MSRIMNADTIFLALPALVFSIILHEVAHGYAAYRLGDPTAKYSNRLTLNPLAHVDLMGSIVLPIFLILVHSPVLFGWAKPVPFNPYYFRNPKKGIMIVGAAGPLTNFALALISGVLFQAVAPFAEVVGRFLGYFCVTNVILGTFNLIPIPPLDGSRVLYGLLPERWLQSYMQIERYGFIILFVLLWGGALDRVIYPVAGVLLNLFMGGR
jgi:Zn-dependent protease